MELVPGAAVDPPGVGGLGIPQAFGDGLSPSRSRADSSRSSCRWAVLTRMDRRSSSGSKDIGESLKVVIIPSYHEFYLPYISRVLAGPWEPAQACH